MATSSGLSNREHWEALHRQSRFLPRYPHERVIQFVFAYFPRARARSTAILDHGCGGGRHLVFLAENGYRTFGVDISESGLRAARRFLKRRGLKAVLNRIGDDDELPYPDNYFDGVVSFGVLYYLSNEQISVTIGELFRVLKPNGRLLAVVRSRRDHRRTISRPTNGDEGMAMHFFTESEIKKWFKDFKDLSIDIMNATHDNKEFLDADFIITAQK